MSAFYEVSVIISQSSIGPKEDELRIPMCAVSPADFHLINNQSESVQLLNTREHHLQKSHVWLLCG